MIERAAPATRGVPEVTATVDLERLRGLRLFIGTPMYSGHCCSAFTLSLAQLTALCTQIGVELRFYFACHEALITKARNVTADEFLRSGDDVLMFIDADIGFDPNDVIRLLALQTGAGGAAFDVIAAPYPIKTIAWENLREAAKRGLADGDPARLAHYASPVAVSPAQDAPFALDRPVEVSQAGTGFMMIRRATFERYRQAWPLKRYRPERIGISVDASDEIHAFFETEIDTKHDNLLAEMRAHRALFPQATADELVSYLESEGSAFRQYSAMHVSEDYAFCRRVREAGMKVWLCPWMQLTHTGEQTFVGRLADLATIDAV
ncbi:hypothetical protein [Novosphingobium sp. JCM 18896]|uniref:hypothetical protein n=1 Tax=Novosphingobium sp. JCM 18896 TaxID=2989731 RepID=UPI00222269F1|nr:hypothetical protein [Novosphingobium sp. JCM 18896]MCW1429622.1 hypothetical protein [Novosphingobium sp. JCM 18896]